MPSNNQVVRIKPHSYCHILDNNANATRVEKGPKTFTLQDHEAIVLGPENMVKIPPRHYAIISNPVHVDEDDAPVVDEHGNYRLRHGDEEIRFSQEPFPLYPGEKLFGSVTALQVVAPNSALRLRCLRDFEERRAGDEWLFRGPGTYMPRVQVQVVEVIRATILQPNSALKLRARQKFTDDAGAVHRAGEEWLVRVMGAYLPDVNEEVLEVVRAHILTQKKALHLRATRTFKDVFGKTRKAGEEWIVTSSDAETHIPDVHEQVVGEVSMTTLNNQQYCVVVDPHDEHGNPRLGQKKLVRGPASFFLQPGERLERGVQTVFTLANEEALLLKAKEQFEDHKPGDRWMIYGPTSYVPPVEVEIIEKRSRIPLDVNEGIYVRDVKTGRVRSVIGESYLLLPNEELWRKELSKEVRDLLDESANDTTRVVSFRAAHNSAVQIYDYKDKKSRVCFGPDLVMLGPDEHFTVLSLSGGKPKQPFQIKSIALLLGPDFMTDIVVVETSDHARLSLKLSYNWQFAVDRENATKLFAVPDFVGDACKAMASRVRESVAQQRFESFHKSSATIIREAIFGRGANGNIGDDYVFESNGLTITNVDIQSVEPVDQRTRDALQKSVQLAIEITTSSQEARAKHEAERLEQGARGRLERQKIVDEAAAEKARTSLLQLQAESSAVESTGTATAEAKARSEAAFIQGSAAVKQATLRAEASTVKGSAEVEQTKLRQEAEVEHAKQLNEIEVLRARELAKIESGKFKSIVNAIGADTLAAISAAGPKTQAKLLEGLGLQSFMVTDGNSPVNLFNLASQLTSPNDAAAAAEAADASNGIGF